MDSHDSPGWLVLDGYEDEPAAFGVPPYVGFHIRYLCGVLEQRGIPYTYMTVDRWRQWIKKDGEAVQKWMKDVEGVACIAGAVVPGRYLRGTPISLNPPSEAPKAPLHLGRETPASRLRGGLSDTPSIRRRPAHRPL